jgi:two-component SAPR family response regulator
MSDVGIKSSRFQVDKLSDVIDSGSEQNTKPRILLVDDDKDIAQIFNMGLRRLGFQIDAFYDSKSLLDRFVPGKYDILISDIRMPGMSGIELYEKIKKLDNKIKIYFLSAYEVYENETKKVNPDLIIKKPISIENLANLITS